MVIDMVFVVIDNDEKIRKFKTLERAEKFMAKKDGVYFVFQRVFLTVYVGVYESKNGHLERKKVEHVHYDI